MWSLLTCGCNRSASVEMTGHGLYLQHWFIVKVKCKQRFQSLAECYGQQVKHGILYYTLPLQPLHSLKLKKDRQRIASHCMCIHFVGLSTAIDYSYTVLAKPSFPGLSSPGFDHYLAEKACCAPDSPFAARNLLSEDSARSGPGPPWLEALVLLACPPHPWAEDQSDTVSTQLYALSCFPALHILEIQNAEDGARLSLW